MATMGLKDTCLASETLSFLVPEGLGRQLRAVKKQDQNLGLDGLEDRAFEPMKIVF